MKKHIVLIEDDFDLRSVTELILQNAGYQVTAFELMTSLETLIDLQPDCYLLDENLPGISGHIICILLKSKPLTKHIPVMLISAGHKLEDAASLSEANARLEKPYRAEDLLTTLSAILYN